MNITFFASEKDREYDIANHFCAGVEKHGDQHRILPTADVPLPDDWTDVAVIIGIKGWSRLLMETYMKNGKHVILIDKGYVGGPSGPRSKYMRVSIDALQPHAYFNTPERPDDRIRALGFVPPWEKCPREKRTPQPIRKGLNVLVAGGSLKYAMWHKFSGHGRVDPATVWATEVIDKLRKRTKRPIVYRPKPSWKDAVPIPDTIYSRPPVTIDEELRNAWALVTYGSNAAVDAVLAGVPVFILGDGIALPFSKNFKAIEDPYYPSDQDKWKWLSNLAYHQYDFGEFKSGFAWSILREHIERLPNPTGPMDFAVEEGEE